MSVAELDDLVVGIGKLVLLRRDIRRQLCRSLIGHRWWWGTDALVAAVHHPLGHGAFGTHSQRVLVVVLGREKVGRE